MKDGTKRGGRQGSIPVLQPVLRNDGFEEEGGRNESSGLMKRNKKKKIRDAEGILRGEMLLSLPLGWREFRKIGISTATRTHWHSLRFLPNWDGMRRGW